MSKSKQGAPRARRAHESAASRKTRFARILAALHELYPDADCALRHRSAYELLVATILSAQCTDQRVNLVTPGLFARYPGANDLAQADPDELSSLIRSTGFFRNKSRNLIAMAKRVVEHFGGEIPETMDELLTLAGVARKTANCILGTWFRKNVGIVVDTHVGRLASRLGLLTTARNDKDAVRVEDDLLPLTPPDDRTFLSHALIEHGRRVCVARTPRCGECGLLGDCPTGRSAGASAVAGH